VAWAATLVISTVVLSSLGLLAPATSTSPGAHLGPLAATSAGGPARSDRAPLLSQPSGPTDLRGPSALPPPNSAALRALAEAKLAGVPVSDVYLPRAAATATGLAQIRAQGHILPPYVQNDPAPIGLADYGLSANPNGNGSVVASVLNSSSLRATFDPNRTGVLPNYPFSSAPDGYALQLNAVTTNVTLLGTSHYSFWTQNVVSYFASAHRLTLITNVWNFSAPGASLTPNVFYGHGPLGQLVGTSFYYAQLPIPTPVTYPFNLTLWMNNSLISGRNAVNFTVALSNSTGTTVYPYDYVIFNSTALNSSVATLSEYTANGFQLNPVGLPDDFELVLGGPGGGRQANLHTADANVTLDYWNASAAVYQSVPSAFSYGGETAETVSGAYVGWLNGTSGAPYGVMRTGPSMLIGLWNATGAAGLGEVNIALSPENAFLFFAPNWTSNFTYKGWEYWAPQESTNDTFWLAPGQYNFTAELTGYNPVAVSVTVGLGTNALVAHLTLNLTKGIYTPLWAWSNAQFAGISTSGTGTTTDPYQIMNVQTLVMAPVFGTLNDFTFPVFAGVFFHGTTASVVMSHMPPLVTAMPYTTTPPADQLGYILENTTNVALVNSTQLSGWFTTAADYNPGPAQFAGNYYGTFCVVMWKSSGDLIANDSFLTQSGGLSMYGGTNNVVWRNTFTMVPFPAFPGPPFGLNLSLGLQEAESGDLVYNNAFDTTVTAVTEPDDLYTGALHIPVDTWNITPTTAATVYYAPNFPDFPLSGTIIGNRTQGGNYWWDYGVTANPIGTRPYTEVVGGTSQIILGGDYYPLVPNLAATYSVTFTESGLPAGTLWSVSLLGVHSSTFPSIAVSLQNGSYSYTVGAIPGYVATPLSGNVSVNGTTLRIAIAFAPFDFPVEFHELGLPSMTSWVVVLAGTHHSSTSARIVFGSPNGTYSFTVPAVPGFVPSPTSGNVTVANTSARVTILFTAFQFPVVIAESGLTATNWSVNVSGSVYAGSGPNRTFSEPNGTYGFTVGSVRGYLATPASGSVTVAGAPVLLNITFTPIPPGKYALSFNETGLPTGTNWSVVLGGAQNRSTGLSVVFLEPNGTYPFTLGVVPGFLAHPASGQTTVNGGAMSVAVLFTPVRYNVTFVASGLPNGTRWSVTVGGLPEGTTSSSLLFEEPNGSYPYAVGPVPGYTSSPSTGTLTVSGDNQSVRIVFSPVAPGEYTVTFTEAGLAPGTPWSVDIGTVPYNSTMSVLSFTERNGTYRYSVGAVVGYAESPPSGEFNVTGGGLRVALTFSAVPPVFYPISFTEQGLPNGTDWSVAIGGVTHISSSDQITFLELNGTYQFAVGSIDGYVVTPGSGPVVLAGSGRNVALTFSAAASPTKTSGDPWTLTWQVGVIVLALIVFLVFVARARRGGGEPPLARPAPVLVMTEGPESSGAAPEGDSTSQPPIAPENPDPAPKTD
jgi:thermopsin